MDSKKTFNKNISDGRRELLHQRMRQRFIGTEERLARCEASAQALGFKSIFSMGIEHGISHQSMKNSLNSPRMSIVRLEELATMLNCSVSYLTERKIEGLK